MIAAAYIEHLDATSRLVLMAIADSSDEHTLEAAPGLPKLRAWSGVSKSQVLRIIAKLEKAGLLEQTVRANRGRRAVWQVFPAGVPAIPHPREVAARYADEDGPVDNSPKMGRTDATHAKEMGRMDPPNGSHGRDPFISLTSVSRREATEQPAARPVDKPAPPASTAPAPGFPGARPGQLLPPNPNTARGARNMPCPRHPDFVVPCGKCAHAAANADQAAIQLAQEEARQRIRGARPASKSTATPEENPA